MACAANPSTKRWILKPGYDGSLHHYYDNYTQSALADELTLALSSKLECDVYEDKDSHPYLSIFRPYLNQAEGLLYRINVYEHQLEFVIFEEDIPQTLRKALRDLGIFGRNQVITEAIRRLYESVDHNYFHVNGLHGKVRWRIAK
jgi:hypothetical protein